MQAKHPTDSPLVGDSFNDPRCRPVYGHDRPVNAQRFSSHASGLKVYECAAAGLCKISAVCRGQASAYLGKTSSLAGVVVAGQSEMRDVYRLPRPQRSAISPL